MTQKISTNQDAPKIHIAETGDGSTTLYSDHFKQHYHNPNGAVAESRHVFFETAEIPKMLANGKNVSVIETGLGTGLNLILMLDYLGKTESVSQIDYISIEAYPITPKQASDLDFGENLENLEPGQILHDVFSGLNPGWNRIDITEKLTLHLFVGFFKDLKEFPGAGKADFFFHDPFSPEANPELWTKEVFQKLISKAALDARLVTYCAASSARAAMATAGWHVARAPGALGKREMTIASPDTGRLSQFKRVNEERLINRYEAGDFDR